MSAVHAIQKKVPLSDLLAVNQPIENARGMPNPAYTDWDTFKFEREHVFAPGWTALTFVDLIPENKTVVPMDFMGLPVFLSRDKTGQIRVFHNVCSHRGVRLVREPRRTNGMVVCPYHAWSYDLTGNLRATPHIGGVGVNTAPGFECKNHGLKEIRSHIWLGVVFVNLSGDAADFEEHASPLLDRYHEYTGKEGLDEIRLASTHGSISFDIKCNWKLAVENYTEAYHLPWVHPDLNTYSPLDKHDNVIISDDFSGQITHVFNPQFEGAPNLPVFGHWPESEHHHAEYPTFYPNLLLGFQVNHVFALIVRPVEPGRVEENLRIFYVGDDANTDHYERTREMNWKAWKQVFTEDVESVEGMQIGRGSPGYVGGAFSPILEGCSHHFHQWVARKYTEAYRKYG
ncbi:MAG: aromatic ring-hydroxylating dioxygenase subunit alpha [Pseudomonadota bacterium]